MIVRFTVSIAFLLITAQILFADYRSGNYKIPGLMSVHDQPMQTGNDIIKGETDSILLPVGARSPVSLRPGQLLMRRKVVAENYALSLGTFDTAAFSLRPPLYSFKIPHWARLEEIIHYRFYRSPTESIGSDETVIYFDSERIYSRFFPDLYYFRNGIWFPLIGTTRKPVGKLALNSLPQGADVFLNGSPIEMRTPCTIEGLIGGIYAVELRLTDYQFFRRTLQVFADSTVQASFELISDMDTAFIIGDARYSLLLLPEPPLDLPYTLDDSLNVYNERIRIAPGSHRLRWSGDERYHSLDTIIDIPEGRVVYFDHIFRRRYGIVRLLPTPPDAEICIEKFGCGSGERIEELPAGYYRVNAYRYGFSTVRHDLHVRADTVITRNINLLQVPDRDGDGFLDSLDDCPDVYGLYKGCPQPQLKTALSGIRREIGSFVSADSLSIGFSLIGMVSKLPTNPTFRNFISVFSSGRSGGVNNYRGMTFLNTVSVTYRGLYGFLDLGQWSAGLKYQRPDTLAVGDDHIVFFDSLFGVKPHIYIPTTAVALGFHYNRSWLNIGYAIGYQWEDIIIEQLFRPGNNTFESVVFDNDWWFHQLTIDVDFNDGDFYVPSLYANFRFPLGTVAYTRWIVFKAGLQLKLFPRPTGKRWSERS